MARKKKHAEHGHDERWLVTYADMITLLMAFFIMMYSISYQDLQKFGALSRALQSMFRGETGIMDGGLGILERGRLSGTKPVAISPNQSQAKPQAVKVASERPEVVSREEGKKGQSGSRTSEPQLQAVQKQLQTYLKQHGLAQVTQVHPEERGLRVKLLAGILFGPGRGELRPEAQPLLRDLARMVQQVPNSLRVEGHTCDLPIRNGLYRSNWELSTIRAVRVVEFLQKCGINPDRLSAVGYGEFQPLPDCPNDSEAHRVRNRRVELVFLNTSETHEKPGSPAVSHEKRKGTPTL